jgi:hypothetical protein
MTNPCAICAVPVTTENLRRIHVDRNNRVSYYCHRCLSVNVGIPDVYLGPGGGIKTEENIADPETGEPIPFWSKESKREAMKRAGVVEAGDRSIHGGPRGGDPVITRGRRHFVV